MDSPDNNNTPIMYVLNQEGLVHWAGQPRKMTAAEWREWLQPGWYIGTVTFKQFRDAKFKWILPAEIIKFDAEHMSLIFLSEIEKIMDVRGIRKTDLAQMLNTSKSYLTQLWRGDKVLSLQMIARIQIALNIKFKIKAHEQE